MISLITSLIGSVVGGLGNSDNEEQTIAILQAELAKSQSSLKTFKLLTYLFGASLLVTVIVLLKRK